MAILFADSFDHYTTILQKYDGSTGSYFSIGPSYGRFGTSGLRQWGKGHWILKNLPSTYSTLWLGFAFNIEVLPGEGLYKGMFQYLAGAGEQAVVCYNSAGQISVWRYRCPGDSGVQLSNWTPAISSATWHYIEIKLVFSQTIGEVEIYVDGILECDHSGLDTCYVAAEYCDAMRMYASYQYTGDPSSREWYDDVYIAQEKLGDCRIIYRVPSGAGNYAQFDPSTGANWECVNENPPDTADYVSTTVADEIDSYAMQDIAQSAGTVKAVVGNYYCQKTDAGVRQLDMLTRLSSTDLLTGSPKSVPSSWGFLQFIQETKPGGGAWSIQDTKDAEMGMKLEV